jgi:predicted TPR repeat methyltransferase
MIDLNTIDWNTLWQREAAASHWNRISKNKASNKDLWDKRADSFTRRINRVKSENEWDKDDYISKMLARIEVSKASSVLDIGCGPGTLTIPLAKKVRKVTALDISRRMLKNLKENAALSDIDNIDYINSSWEDACTERLIDVHDIVIASRSLSPADNIIKMLCDINSLAAQAVYLTFPVVHLPFDWEVYRVIGRGNKKHPSHIYIFNALCQMGIQANVEILYSRVRMQFASIAEAINDLQWRTDPFTAEEEKKLTEYLKNKFAEQCDSAVFTHEGKSQWALIW